jgi:type IV secretory pathway TrbF-like protein
VWHTNGRDVSPEAVSAPDLLLEPSDEWQRIEQAYREIQRRDDRAEHRAWRWERFALALLGVWLVTVGVMVWQVLDARKVQAFVQVVVQDEKGQLLQVGIPQDLLAYAPPDGVWMDMLGEWVRRIRWRGEDTKALARREWAWVYRHTCGQARRLVQAIEDKEQPFKPSKKLVAVELRSITKTPVPESYQVLWTETSTEPNNPSVKTDLWTGTFSVGRIHLPSLADALDNRLGLCVTAFDLSPEPSPIVRRGH